MKYMNEQKFVGIFNPEWQLVVTLSLNDRHLVATNIMPNEYGHIVSSVLERLKTENPKLNLPVKDEDGCVVDMLRVGPEGERYMDGVANELKPLGLQAHCLNNSLLDVLNKVNNTPAGLRVQVVPEVLALDAESAFVALEAIA